MSDPGSIRELAMTTPSASCGGCLYCKVFLELCCQERGIHMSHVCLWKQRDTQPTETLLSGVSEMMVRVSKEVGRQWDSNPGGPG